MRHAFWIFIAVLLVSISAPSGLAQTPVNLNVQGPDGSSLTFDLEHLLRLTLRPDDLEDIWSHPGGIYCPADASQYRVVCTILFLHAEHDKQRSGGILLLLYWPTGRLGSSYQCLCIAFLRPLHTDFKWDG